MKIIDKNGRLFGKVSIIDVVVILVVVVLAAALSLKKSQPQTSTGNSDITITFQLRVTGERDFVINAIQAGDYLYDVDNSSNGALGEIVAAEPIPGMKLGEMNDGTVEYVPLEGGGGLLLTIRGSGIISDGRYLLNRVYNLGVNTTRNYYTPYAQFTATVLSISVE